ADGPSAPLARGSETILLVEDESAILSLGKVMLERLGYRVLAASDPEDALDLARKKEETIDLLITDVIMPTMNGWDMAERLKSLYPNLRVLFMSGYSADVISHRGVLGDGVNFLQKPFSLTELAARVRQAIDV
ncbi:MAG: response regulator, partial [Desulfatirhabdiaceae bacterium]